MRARGRLLPGAVLLLPLAAAGCLTVSQQSRLTTDMEEVRKQVYEMQKSTASVLARMAAVEESVAKQQSSAPARYADLQALMQTLTDEVRALGARLDDNTQRMSVLQREITAVRDQYRTLEARLAAALGSAPPASPAGGTVPPPSPAPSLSTGGTAPPGGAPAGATHPPQSPVSTQARVMSGASATGPQAAPPTAPAEPVPLASAGAGMSASPAPGGGSPAAAKAPPSGTAPSEADQEEAFRAAYSDYTRGAFESAATGFREFLDENPSSPLAGNAWYYLGESWYAQQKYTEATEAFSRAISGFPNGDLTPGAYLKKGLSLLALKQTAQGVVQLQHVIETYPRSEEARVAADRLRQLGLRDR